MTLTESSPLQAPRPILTRQRVIAAVVLLASYVVFTLVLSQIIPAPPLGIDWYASFQPAAWKVLTLQTPYTLDYQNPPWALLAIIPFALLPPKLGHAAFILANFAAFAYFAIRFGARPWVVALFLTSPPVLHSLVNGNIDAISLLGLVLPPQIGLLFIVIKPQMAIAVVIFWLIEAWRNGSWREVVRVFWPLTLITLISFVFFGLWPLHMTYNLEGFVWWNASFWPAAIPIGLALLVAAIRTRNVEYAMGASPALSPYVLLHAYSGAFAALLRHRAEFIAAWIGLWIMVLIQAGLLPSL